MIRKTRVPPEFRGCWDGPVWCEAETLQIDWFHPDSGDHRPETLARVLYDEQSLYVHFKVRDRFVLSIHTRPQEPVSRDSCVEFFFQPKPESGYFNLEGNAGGTFLCSYRQLNAPLSGGLASVQPIADEWFEQLQAFHSLPSRVDPELTGPVDWHLEYRIPRALIEAYAGPLGELAGQLWRANFYKCASGSSHPHWAAWASIGEKRNFHRLDRFAPIRFER